MKEIIDVNTGKVGVAGTRVILRAIAIGSCIVVAAYDSTRKVGAMAHIMLPGRAPKKTSEKTKYAGDAIDEMIKGITEKGSKESDLQICLVGGGNVLKKKDDTIGQDNIESTTELLQEKHIPIRATVLGGTERKGVSLDVENGTVFYTEGDGREKLLWKATKKTTSK